MKMPRQISELIDKYHEFKGYEIILRRGEVNVDTGVTSFAALKFNTLEDLMLFIAVMFVDIRNSLTSCDTILFSEILKSAKTEIGDSGRHFIVEFINYQLLPIY